MPQLSEFSLIERFVTKQVIKNPSTQLSIGDDCALITIPNDYELAITTDTMVENIHFFAGTNPKQLGHKLLAVNLSDLASMGAKPLSITLALTLPNINEQWLSEFSTGLLNLATHYHVDLIGGDTTKGSLTLTVQALGLVPRGKALKRSTAQIGDLIYISNQLGDAGLGLKICQGYNCTNSQTALNRFHEPMPRVELGLVLRDIASACIDISDGLASDLNHILTQSGVGACIHWNKLPLSDAVLNYIQKTGDDLMPLIAGDDYELCFCVNPNNKHLVPASCTQIGIIEKQTGLRLFKNNILQTLTVKGYEHFS